MKRFVALYDLHYGYERDAYRHKKALHDPRVMDIALQFIKDFKPDEIILGGDMLDCGAISHHNKRKPARIDGLRMLSDAHELNENLIRPLTERNKNSSLTYIIGNHEDWIADIVDEWPGLEGVVSLENLLDLDRWRVVPQGGFYRLGKLYFIHGDSLGGAGEYAAKKAVLLYESSVRLGHYHTYQVYTKTSALALKLPRTGMIVPCMCTRDPKYGEGRANSWVQGFTYGYVRDDGSYSDYVALIVNNRVTINGKDYRG